MPISLGSVLLPLPLCLYPSVSYSLPWWMGKSRALVRGFLTFHGGRTFDPHSLTRSLKVGTPCPVSAHCSPAAATSHPPTCAGSPHCRFPLPPLTGYPYPVRSTGRWSRPTVCVRPGGSLPTGRHAPTGGRTSDPQPLTESKVLVMERRTPHRILRTPRLTDVGLSSYIVTAHRSTDLIPGYWRLVTVCNGRAHVRQYPHMEHDRALAHFGWFVTNRASADDFYASLENASGNLVDEFERRGGSDYRPPTSAHLIVVPTMPNAPVGVL